MDQNTIIGKGAHRMGVPLMRKRCTQVMQLGCTTELSSENCRKVRGSERFG